MNGCTDTQLWLPESFSGRMECGHLGSSLHICRVGESFLPVPLGSCRDSSKEEDGGQLWLGL